MGGWARHREGQRAGAMFIFHLQQSPSPEYKLFEDGYNVLFIVLSSGPQTGVAQNSLIC